ncbi:PA-phosphatase [Variovorax paradoxus]|uniref:phosphatase PAP2 family protein n=1 Tax=Variovorax paradoxus TaxID=34073 RepID=UPI0006E4D802|nr:PA-phosphatase [Variovorax paradoxus]KPV06436.1 PA-phosphatase [Variovorax paradoxus]KPV09073.1 PA-phosphatase [Variovorax paradoxus]KPV22936.1 PA-phosphatase [Variovorax paradoxus]KPV33912.1 PA-phosphatase [Variovorax paradoxus]
MHATLISAAWLKQWLYDWGGANLNLFMFLNQAVPDQLLWLPEVLSWVGSYWGAPAIAAVLLVWRQSQAPDAARSADLALRRFVFGLVIAMSSAALLKAAFAFPRPAVVLGEGVFRIVGVPDSRYSFPSGHAAYVAVLAAAIWPVAAWPGRIGLLAFAIAVGWSRIALGAHFPADVVASFVLGWACVEVSAALIWLLVPRARATR